MEDRLERLRMALEAILCLESYHSIEIAQKMAQRALQGVIEHE